MKITVNKFRLVALIVGWILALSGLIVWIKRDTTELVGVVTNENKQVVTIPDRDNPYLILSMAKRSFASQIKVIRNVRETDSFLSQVVEYDSDGLNIFALMNTPKGGAPKGGWPVVIVNHGHIPPSEYSTENSYINTSGYYASQGFLVLKPDYRGHGKSDGQADLVLSRINYAVDVLNLLEGIKKLGNINPERIYMYGHSMGGDVTLRVIEICPDCVKAASLWAPAVTEWPESFLYFSRKSAATDSTQKQKLNQRLKELENNFVQEEYPLVSTISNIERVDIPILIHHGTADQSVPYTWGVELANRLTKEGKKVTFYSYSNDNHDISGNWSLALNRDVEFFRKQ